MNLNEDKCHLPVAGHKCGNIWIKIGEAKIWESNKQNCCVSRAGEVL